MEIMRMVPRRESGFDGKACIVAGEHLLRMVESRELQEVDAEDQEYY